MMLLAISHLSARIPSSECKIRFMLKQSNMKECQQIDSKYPLISTPISIDLQQTITINSQLITISKNLILCVIVLLKQSVIYIGHININPYLPAYQKLEKLVGIKDQDGYITYTISTLSNSLLNIKQPFISNIQQHTPNTHILNHRQQVSFEQDDSQNRGDMQRLNDQRLREDLENKIINYQLSIQLMQIQLTNNYFKSKLHQNQLFNINNRDKIKRIIGYYKIPKFY